MTVNHVDPQIQNFAATTINEGGTSFITGTIVSVSSTDTYMLTIDFGDGTEPMVVNLPAQTSNFQVAHTYVNNKVPYSLTPIPTFAVTAVLKDSQGGTASAATAATVTNVAPLVSFTVDPSIGPEGGAVKIGGVVIDPGILDYQAVTIDWGDGSQTVLPNLDPNGATTHTFEATHTYLNNVVPNIQANDLPFAITVTARDYSKGSDGNLYPDLGEDTQSNNAVVQDVSPTINNLSLNGGGLIMPGVPVTLTGTIFDPGILDYQEVTIDWGDGTVDNFTLDQNGTSNHQLLFPNGNPITHTYVTPNAYTVNVIVEDKSLGNNGQLHPDYGVGTASANAIMTGVYLDPTTGTLYIGGTSSADTVTVRQPAIPVGYWNLNDPAGQSVAADSSPTKNNGTFFTVPRGTFGASGVPANLAPFGALTSASFAQSRANYLSIPDNAAYHLANGTVEFWFNPTRLTGSQTLFSKGAVGDPNALNISLSGQNLVATLGANTIQTGLPSGGWHNVALAFGEGGMRLFLNGVLVGQNAYTGGLTSNLSGITLGGPDFPFLGSIDEVGIYATPFTALDIQNVMQQGPLGGNDPKGPTVWVYASFLDPAKYPNQIASFATAQVTSIVAYLGAGNDSIRIDPSVGFPAAINTGDGNDQAYAGSGPSNLVGGDGDDVLVGSPVNDIISAGKGNNNIVGRGGVDTISAGGGTNTLGLPPTLPGLSGNLANYTFQYKQSGASFSLEVTDTGPAGGMVSLQGISKITFGDGTVAYLLDRINNNPPSLSSGPGSRARAQRQAGCYRRWQQDAEADRAVIDRSLDPRSTGNDRGHHVRALDHRLDHRSSDPRTARGKPNCRLHDGDRGVWIDQAGSGGEQLCPGWYRRVGGTHAELCRGAG